MNILVNVLCLVVVFLLGYGIGEPDGRAAATRKERRAQEKLARAREELAQAQGELPSVAGVFVSEPIAPWGGDG